MRIYRLGSSVARAIERFGSRGVTIGDVARGPAADIHVAIATLEPGGEIGRHETVGWQLLYVVEGSGWVCGGDDERSDVSAGWAASWAPGELHTTGSDDGMVAVIVETNTNVVPRRSDNG